MVEGDKLANTPSGVFASAEAILGAAFVGARIFGREHGDDHGRNGGAIYNRARR